LPIPRGGYVVNGLLCYALSLEGNRLADSDDRSRPLMIVDDCALTGSRFRQIMRETDRERVVFVHLCSSPELRNALMSQEPSLTHVVAAHDLHDLASERLGSDFISW